MSAEWGTIDRAARFAAGVVLIASAIPIGFAPSGWNWLGWIGVVPLTTAMFGFRPPYTLIDLSTCPMKRAR